MRITVLAGGWSPEREISLMSAECVVAKLKGLGHEVYELDVRKDLRYISDELYKARPDFIFNMLHGIGGEDGVMQGLLEIFGIPYSNSGVLGTAIAFHKPTCKKLAGLAGIRVIEGFDINKDDIKKINADSGLRMEYPFVIKPAANGSSVGVFLIFDEQDLARVKGTDWVFDDEVLIEKYIDGREFTTLVVDGKMIGTLEITHKNRFYDYESKYDVGGSTHISSFELNRTAREDMYRMSEAVFKACHCQGLARVDFRFDGSDVYFMEINTQPGMTELSLAPDIARFNGLSLGDLLNMSLRKATNAYWRISGAHR
jgi:D-alanine-D-alanine ligase